MRIVLEVDSHDNGITTGTLWDLLDDLKATEQIKDYKIDPLEAVAYTVDDGLCYLDRYCSYPVMNMTDQQKAEFAIELNSRMYDQIEGCDGIWERMREIEKVVALEILKEQHLLKEE